MNEPQRINYLSLLLMQQFKQDWVTGVYELWYIPFKEGLFFVKSNRKSVILYVYNLLVITDIGCLKFLHRKFIGDGRVIFIGLQVLI